MNFKALFKKNFFVLARLMPLLLFVQINLNAQYCKPIENYPETGGYIGFGWRPTEDSKYHNGADFAANVGDKVYASRSGYVIYSMEANGFGSLNPSSTGGVIIIKHQNNYGHYYYTVYGHIYRNLNYNSSGQPGEYVVKGQEIGTIRPFTNGSASCPHLHYGININSVFPSSGWGYSTSLSDWRDPKSYLDSNCGPMETTGKYPDVNLIKGSSPDIYLLKNNILHKITNWNIYQSLEAYYSAYQDVSDSYLAQFLKGSQIISDGLICKEENNAKIYLIQYNQKRAFQDESSYTSRDYKLSGGDPISPTVLWLPDGMLSGLSNGPDITPSGVNVTGELYFKKNDQIATVFSVGETINSYFNLTSGDGYTVFSYVRLSWPDGTQKYCYYPDGQTSGSYSFSDEKRPLTTVNGIGKTFNVVPSNWNTHWQFNTYSTSGSTDPGQYTVEFWYEDINKPDEILFKDTKSYTIQQSEEISTPSTATGPSMGKVGQSVTFSSGGANSNLGHSIQYQFDWGDGTQSNWGPSSQTHSYSSTGTQSVKVHARCQSHPGIISGWSGTKTVSISYCMLSVYVNPSGTGSVNKTPNKTNFSYNESVQLTAVASSGFLFDYWAGDVNGSTDSINLTMNDDKNVTAHFKSDDTNIIGNNPELHTPEDFALQQNYPNPFNPETIITFRVPVAAQVSIKIFNSGGEVVRHLMDAWKPAGEYNIIWNGCDNSGEKLSTGIYYYVMQSGHFRKMQKAVFIK